MSSLPKDQDICPLMANPLANTGCWPLFLLTHSTKCQNRSGFTFFLLATIKLVPSEDRIEGQISAKSDVFAHRRNKFFHRCNHFIAITKNDSA